MIYWNPNAKNGNLYHPDDNPNGSWYVKNRTAYYTTGVAYSSIDGRIPSNFVTDAKSVFYTFSTLYGNTQIIIPIFATTDTEPTLSLKTSGSGTVSVVTPADLTSVGTNKWKGEFATNVVVRAEGSNFIGWYDSKGVLVSTSRDYHLVLVESTDLTAKFGTETVDVVKDLQNGKTIVWLQSTTGTAGTDFYLKSFQTGKNDNRLHHVAYSNINDTTGNKQIACYWNLNDSQMLTAVAPNGYHWEQLFSDGTSMRLSDSNEYTFIASTNIKLVAVANNGSAFETTVMIDEAAFDDDRTNLDLRVNGQVLCATGEEVVACGIVFTDYQAHNELPSIDCGRSSTISATAWNSTTGQFVVEFSIAGSPKYVLRGYAIVRQANGDYLIRYGECVTTVF